MKQKMSLKEAIRHLAGFMLAKTGSEVLGKLKELYKYYRDNGKEVEMR